jgi:hypothetical protein
MKKLLSVVCVVLLLTAVSCASKAQGGTTGPGIDNTDVPGFLVNPPQLEDSLLGIGIAKMSNMNMSRNMAENRARVAISQQLSTHVRNMIDDMASESEGDRSTVLNFSQSVSRSLSEANLVGTKVIENYVAKDGTFYCLMSYSIGAAQKLAEDQINFNKSKAEYAAARNIVAQEQMDAAFDKLSGTKPFVVQE